MRPMTKAQSIKYYNRRKVLDGNDLNEAMMKIFYSIRAGRDLTDKLLTSLNISEHVKDILLKNEVLKPWKNMYWFSAYDTCKEQKNKWDKIIATRLEVLKIKDEVEKNPEHFEGLDSHIAAKELDVHWRSYLQYLEEMETTTQRALEKFVTGNYKVKEDDGDERILVSASDDIWLSRSECEELGIPIPF